MFSVSEHAKNHAFFHVGGDEDADYFDPITDFESVHTMSG
jgi:hypothetical protein